MRRGSILAIDADPNSCLADALGVKDPLTIVATCDEISKDMGKVSAGMPKDRYIEMRVQEALVEGDAFDMMVMGRPEGPGCYCYVNNLLRNCIAKLVNNYDFVVIDNAAGMEHISRRTAGSVGRLVIVSDYSAQGVRAAKKIYALAGELGIKIGKAFLVVNMVSGPLSALEDEINAAGLKTAGSIPDDKAVVKMNLEGRSVFQLNASAKTRENVDDICREILKS